VRDGIIATTHDTNQMTQLITVCMRKLMLLICTLFMALVTYGQDITGQWNGILKVGGTQLRLVLNIKPSENGYSSTLDSPDQGANGIPVSQISFEDALLAFEISSLGIGYSGMLNDDGLITGTFTQMGQSFPLDFSQKEVKKEKLDRPQEPKKPFPYYSEEISFTNTIDSITLAGTLTLPSKGGKHPVVVLISGSGPQNRDEELAGHKPFLIIADHLTRKGVGVLRFDDRGTGESTGDFKSATSKDFARDVQSAVSFLKFRNDIDHQNIGLVGHSEGGLIAPMVASKSKDIAFIVLLAAPGISGYDIVLQQTELIAKANGADESKLQKEVALLKGGLDIVVEGNNLKKIKQRLRDYLNGEISEHPELLPEGTQADTYVSTTVNLFATPWFQYFLKYDPRTSLINVRCPVLAINGEKDLQVPSKINLSKIEAYLKKAGNNDFVTKEMPNLNHLFQECTTGSPIEYGIIEQTFSPTALSEISDWILSKVN